MALLTAAATTISEGRYFREHVNDLPALLKAVSIGPYVVLSTFDLGYREFAANFHYAIQRFGRVSTVLLATFDERSLVECLILGFHCFNGSTMIPDAHLETRCRFGMEKGYCRVTWSRVVVAHAVMLQGYTVMLSDLDTVWVKDALRSFAYAMDYVDADLVALNDQSEKRPNCGNLMIKNNARTRTWMQTWIDTGFDFNTRTFKDDGDRWTDQSVMTTLKGKVYDVCFSSAECLAVKAQGRAAMYLHPWHWCPGMAPEGNQEPCNPLYAYIHIFCTAGGTVHKTQLAKGLRYWFVGSDAKEPHMTGARATDLVNATGHYRFSAEALQNNTAMPCPNELPEWNLS